jgi:CTP synthase (UTP-ammonia lyase)
MHPSQDDTVKVSVIGDRRVGFAPQDAIGASLEHAAVALGRPVPQVRWVPTDVLASDGPEALAGSTGVWCGPGAYRSFEGALAGLRWVREAGLPFLGTCAGFQHAVVEFARNVLGHGQAGHAEYEPPAGTELIIDELLCSLVGQTLNVDLCDAELVDLYGATRAVEQYYCRFGLDEAWRGTLEHAGLLVAGVDAADGGTRILRLNRSRFYVLTLFVPQTSSRHGSPHPLVTGFLEAASTRSAAGTGSAA